jgi:hypothetical protein
MLSYYSVNNLTRETPSPLVVLWNILGFNPYIQNSFLPFKILAFPVFYPFQPFTDWIWNKTEKNRLHTLYTQWWCERLVEYVLPRLLAHLLVSTYSQNEFIIHFCKSTLQHKLLSCHNSVSYQIYSPHVTYNYICFIKLIHLKSLNQTFVHCPIFFTADSNELGPCSNPYVTKQSLNLVKDRQLRWLLPDAIPNLREALNLAEYLF